MRWFALPLALALVFLVLPVLAIFLDRPPGELLDGAGAQALEDAGFLYVSDVRATGSALEAIELPDELQPSVAYGVAVVVGAPHPEEAQAFVDGLLDDAGAQALADAGFEPPPGE